MMPRSFKQVDVSLGDENYVFTQLKAVCEYSDGSPATIMLATCSTGRWDVRTGMCTDGTESCSPIEPGCVTLHDPADYSPLEQYVTPFIECSGPPFNRMPSTTELTAVEIFPPVEENALFVLFRYLNGFGFESMEEIKDSVLIAGNYMNAAIMNTVELQGNVFKVGPTTEEFQAMCTVTLNAFLEAGTAINGNSPVNASDLQVTYLPCVASEIMTIQSDIDNLMERLADIGDSNVQCRDSDNERGAARDEEGAPGSSEGDDEAGDGSSEEDNEGGDGSGDEEDNGNGDGTENAEDNGEDDRRRLSQERSAGPLERSSWGRALRRLRERHLAGHSGKGGGDGNHSRNEWDFQDGQDCDTIRAAQQRILSTALSRAFMFTGKDAYGGCKYLLDSWTESSPVTTYSMTDKCQEPAWDADGQWTRKWLDDPCCNEAKRSEMCCAPRNISTVQQVVSGVNEEAISEYSAATNTGDLAMRLALQYAKLEGDAATECFPPFKDQWDSISKPWEIMDKCFDSVLGSYKSSFQQELGAECTVASDCWTLECAKPRVAGGASSNNKKYCKTPINTESQDFVGPIVRCLVATSPPVLAEYFEFEVLKMTGNATLEEGVASLGLDKYECWGNGLNAWSKRTEAECLKERVCNWNRDVTTSDECLMPCESKGGAPCPHFCGRAGLSYEVGNLPVCLAKSTSQMSPIDECQDRRGDAQQSFDRACDECQKCINQCNPDCEESDTEGDRRRLEDHSHGGEDAGMGCYDRCVQSCPDCESECDFGGVRDTVQQCVSEKCGNITDGEGNTAVANADGECIFPSLSFDASHESTCESQCHAEGGPMPVPSNRCYARIKGTKATQETCSSLGSGWIEPMNSPSTLESWDYSRGDPPPEYCVVHDFLALNGKPYVPPPPYGPSCSQTCEQEFDRCMTASAEQCYMPADSDDEEGKSVQEACQEIFEQFKDAFESCIAGSCEGAGCLTRKLNCLTTSGLLDDEQFATLGCMECGEEWTDPDLMDYQCSTAAEDASCQWSGSMDDDAPCSSGCIESLCRDRFDGCVSTGGSPASCAMQVNELNQCRMCELARCDEKCMRPCEDAFDSWEMTEYYCSGCMGGNATNETEDNDTDHNHSDDEDEEEDEDRRRLHMHKEDEKDGMAMCFPGSRCYGDRKCWGYEPPYGRDCPLSCERQIENCQNEGSAACNKLVSKSMTEMDRCNEVFTRVYERRVDSCVTRMEEDPANAYSHYDLVSMCARDILPADWPCWHCESGGRWNAGVWETMIGPECLAGNRTTVDSNCASHCKPATCPTYSPACTTQYVAEQMCVSEYIEPYDLQLCKVSQQDAKVAVVAMYPDCASCGSPGFCERDCERRCGSMDNWMDPYRKCSGCSSDYECNPTSDCYISMEDPNVTMSTEDGSMSMRWKMLYDEIDTCFSAGREHDDSDGGDGEDEDDEGEDEDRRLAGSLASTPVPQQTAAARVQAAPLTDRKAAKIVEELGRLRRVSMRTDRKSRKYHGLMKHRRALQAKLPRRLQEQEPQEVRLSCTSGDCTRTETLCNNFFQRGGDEQARVDDVVESHNFGPAPWEDSSKICREFENPICFISYTDLWELVAANYTPPEWLGCAEETGACTGCGGCDGTPGGTCESCCVCQTGEAGALAYQELEMEYSGMDSLASLYLDIAEGFDAEALGDFHYDDRLMNGMGGFVYSLPMDEHSGDDHGHGSAEGEGEGQGDGDGDDKEDGETTGGEGDGENGGDGETDGETDGENDGTESGDGERRLRGRGRRLAGGRRLTGGRRLAGHGGEGGDEEDHEGDEDGHGHSRGGKRAQQCIHPKFKRFQLTRVWRPGHLDNRSSCEAATCFPDSWLTSKEDCDSSSYCDGECPYCEVEGFDDPETRPEPKCQFTTINGGALSMADCRKACGGSFNDKCKYVNNRLSGKSICLTPPPADAAGQNMQQKCRGQQKKLSGASVSQVTYSLLSCADMSRVDCRWARKSIPDMMCSIQRLPCKTRADCNAAGSCDYMVEGAEVREQGGICVAPFPKPVFTRDMEDPEFVEDCSMYQKGSRRAEPTSYGCVISSSSMSNSTCVQAGNGAKWHTFAYTQSECEVSGFAWSPKGSGTYACCLQWFGSGSDIECERYSMDNTSASCRACGGRWVSIFKFARSGSWIQGRWKKSYSFMERKFEPINSWIPVIDQQRLTTMFENVVQSVKAGPLKNLIDCRLNPALDSIKGLADKKPPVPKLGEATILPGQATSQNFGKVSMETTSESYKGTDALTIELGLESSQNNLNTGGTTGSPTPGARQLTTSSIADLTASCYAVVTQSSKTVGQLVGDCVSFQPSQTLTGPVTLCTTVDTSIPTNPQFTVKGFTMKEGSAFVVLSNTVTEDGTRLCTSVQNNGTYCPMQRFSDYTSSSVVSADNSCPALQSVANSITQRAEQLQNTSTFTGSGGIVLVGQVTTTTTRPPASFTVIVPTTTMTTTMTATTTTETMTTQPPTTTMTDTATTMQDTTMQDTTTMAPAGTTVASSGDTTTPAPAATEVVVTGSCSMTVSDPAGFAASEKVKKDVLPPGLAAGLPGKRSASDVTVNSVTATRRLSADRRLQGGVNVDYSVNYGNVDLASIDTASFTSTGGAVEQGIKEALTAANLDSTFTVSGVTVAEPTKAEVAVTTTTLMGTTQEPELPTAGSTRSCQALFGMITTVLLVVAPCGKP